MALLRIGKLRFGRQAPAAPEPDRPEARPDPDDPARFDAPEYVHYADYDRDDEYSGYNPQAPQAPGDAMYDGYPEDYGDPGFPEGYEGDAQGGYPGDMYDGEYLAQDGYGGYADAPYGGYPDAEDYGDGGMPPQGGGGYGGYGDYPDGGYPGEGYPDGGYPRGDYPGEDPSAVQGYAPAWWERALDWLNAQTWPIWVLLLVLPPLGIWLLWRYQRYRQTARTVLSVLSIAWCVFGLSRLIPPSEDTSHLSLLPANEPQQPVQAVSSNLPEYTESILANTPMPVTDAEEDDPDAVYIDEGGSFYHKSGTCTALSGGSLRRVTSQSAANVGLFACPYCMAGTYTENTWDLVFVNSDTADRSGFPVYCTQDDNYLHVNRYCEGVTNLKELTLKDSLLMGRSPCPNCCGILERKVYFTADGTYFHIDPECSGMRNASHPSYAEALVTGKKRCPRCLPGEDKFLASVRGDTVAEPAAEYYVYATAKGKYYHVQEHCQGMNNASKVLLRDMLDKRRPACPVCCPNADLIVFIADSSPYYHSYISCSGITDATQTTLMEALASGKTKCTECWAQDSQ